MSISFIKSKNFAQSLLIGNNKKKEINKPTSKIPQIATECTSFQFPIKFKNQNESLSYLKRFFLNILNKKKKFLILYY